MTYDDEVNKLFPEDAQIAGLAYQASVEAGAIDSDPRYQVAGMAVLLVGKQAIFASTLRTIGNSGVRHQDQRAPNFFEDIIPASAPMKQQLLACALQNGSNGKNQHENKGNCGETVAMQVSFAQTNANPVLCNPRSNQLTNLDVASRPSRRRLAPERWRKDNILAGRQEW